jgi:hypothetical protein
MYACGFGAVCTPPYICGDRASTRDVSVIRRGGCVTNTGIEGLGTFRTRTDWRGCISHIGCVGIFRGPTRWMTIGPKLPQLNTTRTRR